MIRKIEYYESLDEQKEVYIVKLWMHLHALEQFPVSLLISVELCVCGHVRVSAFVGSTELILSVILFRQPAGYIPPSHAALGETHLCDLY